VAEACLPGELGGEAVEVRAGRFLPVQLAEPFFLPKG
jgi:hypothetical protein